VNYTAAPKAGLWRGFRLIGCDGSTLRLPTSEELALKFGKYPGKGEPENFPVMARISEYTDMSTKLVLSGRIAVYGIFEVALAVDQLEELVPKMREEDLLLGLAAKDS